MLKKVKARVVGGEKGYVPVYDDAVPKGGKYTQIDNGKIVTLPMIDVLTLDELRKYVDSGYIQIWDESGKMIGSPRKNEAWMEITHLEIITESSEFIYHIEFLGFSGNGIDVKVSKK